MSLAPDTGPEACRECWGLGGREQRGGPGKCERCGREWKPLLAIKNSRSFGALRGLAMRAATEKELGGSYVQGFVRFGWGADGYFRIEALTGGPAR